MFRDPIVEEVRTIREELAARFDFDIGKIVEDAQKRQASSQARVISFQKTDSLQRLARIKPSTNVCSTPTQPQASGQ